MRRRLALATLILLIVHSLWLWGIQSRSLTEGEAWAAWAIQYDEQRPPELSAGIRAQANYLLDHLQSTWARSGSPLVLALDAWTLMMGDSPLSLRLWGVWAGVLALALFLRGITQRWFRQTHWRAYAYGVLGASALVVLLIGRFSPVPPIVEYVQQAQAVRDPAQPALILYAPESALAYHARQMGLEAGLALRLNWRAFSETELRRYTAVTRRAEQVWLMSDDEQAPALSILSDALRRDGRQVVLTWRERAILIQIWE